jgi:UDP-N-acetyl-D-mannosaminuronate dehydrogenase
VTIFISSATELAEVEEALRLYEKVTGSSINIAKSKALATGGWMTQETVLGISYHQSVTILGITFWGTIPQTTNDTWARITGKVRAQAQKAYDRDPNIDTIIKYIHANLLTKLWYTAQILPAPILYIQKI